MINRFRRTAAAAVTVLALGAGGAAWAAASASASATPAAIGKCAAGNLAVWVNADSADGTAGTTYFHLDFTNTGRSACFLNGYPGVSATTDGGARIGQAAVRFNGVPAKNIVLAPDATAHVNLGYADIVVEPSCKPKTATFLKVFPPNDTVAKHAFFPLSVCTTGHFVLTVQRVESGA
jgi:uncharacterized protein DUF4232